MLGIILTPSDEGLTFETPALENSTVANLHHVLSR